MSSRGKIRAGIISKHQHHFPSFSKSLLPPAHIPLLLSCLPAVWFSSLLSHIFLSSVPLFSICDSLSSFPLLRTISPISFISHSLNCQIRNWHENKTFSPTAMSFENLNLSSFAKIAFKAVDECKEALQKPNGESRLCRERKLSEWTPQSPRNNYK